MALRGYLLQRKRMFITIMLVLLVLLLSTVIYIHTHKPLPEGLSFAGETHYTDDVRFLYDLTYKDHNGDTVIEQQIFERIFSAVDEAEEFIVLDMFLFNPYYNEDLGFPRLTETLTSKLIKKKQQNEKIQIAFITDEINIAYGSHSLDQLDRLEEAGIEVIFSELNQLRDSNPLYSSVWRTFFQWFGQSGTGWLPNPMADNAPKVTMRSYLQTLNIKANHRKVFITDKTSIVTSANPHDASGFHSNIAFEVSSSGLKSDLLKSEQAVADYSRGGKLPEYMNNEDRKGDIAVQVLTEGKIYKELLHELRATEKGNHIWLGMFYLADRKVMDELKNAARRDVKINIILDPNQNAFGSQKMGLPNIPIAAELMKIGSDNIEIRWYNTGEEQYHSKFMYVDHGRTGTIIGGSANFTQRNLDDLNLETNLKLKARTDTEFIQDVRGYFNRLWHNEDGEFTVEYEQNKEPLTIVKYIGYSLQKLFRFTTY
ncbi:phospholipase D family protein [Mesobacillus harenae]|uniref:phospholipase D family protein n=1 Tax=Mesobacillus harenae TaxID=2213203 RepID=UPI001F54FEF4|nr:phospholipase D family protein [Mesobacillus harenae]